jgi:uncharacterized protein
MPKSSDTAQPFIIPDLRKEDFYEKLVALPYVEAVYVYGSYSTGRAHEQSDFDLAVECPEATKEQWEEIKNIIYNSVCLLPLDVARIDTLKPGPFRDYMMRHRSLLYLRAPVDHLSMLGLTLDKVAAILPELEANLREAAPSDAQMRQILAQFSDVFRLFVRVLRRTGIVMGTRTSGRIPTLRQSLKSGLIKDRRLWENIYKDWEVAQRNPTMHIAYEIIDRLRSTYFSSLETGIRNLQKWHEEEVKLNAQDEPERASSHA